MPPSRILSRGREWVADDIALLCRLVERGESVEAIAHLLGRSRWAVYARLRSEGVERRRGTWSPAELLELADMCGVISQRKAAAILGRPRTQVQRAIDDLGLYWPPATRSPVRFDTRTDHLIRRGVARGDTWRRIAAEVGRQPQAVRRRAQRLGVAEKGHSRLAA